MRPPAAVEVSDAYAVHEIVSGAEALMLAISPIARPIETGSAARTRIAGVPAIFAMQGDRPWMITDRALVPHVRAWLHAASC